MSWMTVKLTDLASVSSGGGAPQDPDAFSTEGIPFIRAGSLIKLLEGMPEEQLELLQPEIAEAHRLKLFPAGTVLFAKSGMSATKGHIYQLKKPAYIVNHLAALIPHSESAGSYLRHVLQFRSPTCLIKDEAYPSIRLGDIEQMEVPAPKEDLERKRMAAILDQADELCRKRHRAMDRLNQLGQAIFYEMFCDPENTNTWKHECQQINSVCTKVTDGTHQSPNWSDTGVPFIFVSNVRNHKIDFQTKKFVSQEEYNTLTRNAKIEAGDVLYTCVGSYGHTAVVDGLQDFVFQRHIAHLKPNKNLIDPEFLAWALETPSVKQQADRLATGIAQKTVTLKALKSIIIPVPPIEEQRRFSQCIAELENQYKHLMHSQKDFSSLFASLQKRAFKGEL